MEVRAKCVQADFSSGIPYRALEQLELFWFHSVVSGRQIVRQIDQKVLTGQEESSTGKKKGKKMLSVHCESYSYLAAAGTTAVKGSPSRTTT